MALDVRLYQDATDNNWHLGAQPLDENRIQVLLFPDANSDSNGYLKPEPLFVPPLVDPLPSALTSTVGAVPGAYEFTGHVPKVIAPVQPPVGAYALTGFAPAITVDPHHIAYVGGQSLGFAGSLSNEVIPFALTGGLSAVPQEGDLVVISYGIGAPLFASAVPAITTAGYTDLPTYQASSATSEVALRVFHKRMTSTPDTSVTITATGNAAYAGAVNIRVYRGVSAAQVLDNGVQSAGASGNTPPNDKPNPPSYTPVSHLAAVLVFGAHADAVSSNYTAPAGVDSATFLSAASSDTTDVAVASGHALNWETGAVDIGPFEGGSTGANAATVAITIALRPAALISYQPNSSYFFFGRTAKISKWLETPAASYALNGFAPAITAGGGSITVDVPLGTYALTGAAPAITRSLRIDVPAGTYTQTGIAPTTTRALRVEAVTGTYALAGAAPALLRALTLSAPAGTYALTGFAPVITYLPYETRFIGGQVDRQKGRTTNWPALTFSLTTGISERPQAGDLVLVFYAIASNPGRTPDPTIEAPSGYTAGTVLRATGSNFVISGRYFYKIMGSTPDTEITFGQTFDVRDPGAIAIRVYRNVDPVVFDITPATMTGTGATAGQNKPNPAAVTPVSANTVIVAFGAQGTTTAVDFTAPAELDAATFQTITETDNVDITVGAGDTYDWTSGSFDIGIFGGGVSNANNAQLAFTLALRQRVVNQTLNVPAGSYSLTGYAPAINTNRIVNVPAGSFSLTGHAPTLPRSVQVSAPAGAFSLTGYAPTLTTARIIAAPLGTFSLTGHAPTITEAALVSAPAGSYALTGNTPTITRALRFTSPVGTYALTGAAPTTTRALQIAPPAGAYSLTGQAPVIARRYEIAPPAGAYSLTGYAPATPLARISAAPAGLYALTGLTPALRRALVLSVPAGAYALTGAAPSITTGRFVAPNPGEYQLSLINPTITRTFRIEAPSGDYALTLLTPIIGRAYRIDLSLIDPLEYSLTLLAPSLPTPYRVTETVRDPVAQSRLANKGQTAGTITEDHISNVTNKGRTRGVISYDT